MKFAFLCILFVVGAVACSSNDPTVKGFPVEANGSCHNLQLEQCKCCEDGEPNCTAAVNYLVSGDTAWSNLDSDACKPLLDAALEDSAVFCKKVSSSQSGLFLACQGFPPGSGPPNAEADTQQVID